ncbi:TetR/AcrR family transcriptional regulator [Gordonia alkaliphila]|uniref:TetR/AcrR family transcriptional regulator n=1 Tax=Gordonia alkaliphila TaxID=1053547 RepID=UPI001FF5F5D2|nr:TetR/AcrR family transcriptional regulator [Gordonia alkaliphila]MCK0440667.1 TetR/AcrR family transcriptional regulator [Gordonia alkaliphila]
MGVLELGKDTGQFDEEPADVEAASGRRRRRVGLAKSNVMRYFESREAVLLELLVSQVKDFFPLASARLSSDVVPQHSATDRAAAVAAALSAEFAKQPTMCELLDAQAGALERNISAATAADYKRAGYETSGEFAAALRRALPELDEPATVDAVKLIVMLVGTIWINAHPPAAVQEAYAADPGLTFLPDGFERSLENAIRAVLLGLLAQATDPV